MISWFVHPQVEFVEGFAMNKNGKKLKTGYLQLIKEIVFKFILTLDALIVSGKKRLERNQIRRFEPLLRESMECH